MTLHTVWETLIANKICGIDEFANLDGIKSAANEWVERLYISLINMKAGQD